MTRHFSWLTACVLAVFLAACGFHLRGLGDAGSSRQYPFRSIYIDSSKPVAAAIAGNLKYDPRVRLLSSATHADAVLRIVAEHKSKDISSINRSGQTSEYRLTYSVTARLYMKGYQIGPDIMLKQFRTMTYSDSTVLGKDQEETLLWDDMMRNSAQLMLYRLSTTQMNRAAADAEASAALGKAPDAGARP
jgi:LPS-assembly lipoprotein